MDVCVCVCVCFRCCLKAVSCAVWCLLHPHHLFLSLGGEAVLSGVWIGRLNGPECLSQGLSVSTRGVCIQLRRPWEMMCALLRGLGLCASLRE